MSFRTRMFPALTEDKRWEDVEVLLDAGIDVLTTMNIQHLESLNDQIWQISGIRVRETVPDWVVQQADEVVMVDLTPRALFHRLQRGVVYEREKAEQALQKFFRESYAGGAAGTCAAPSCPRSGTPDLEWPNACWFRRRRSPEKTPQDPGSGYGRARRPQW